MFLDFKFIYLIYFETESHDVAQATLELYM